MVRGFVVENVKQNSRNDCNRRPDENVDRHAEPSGPVIAVESDKQSRNQEEDGHFTDVQPAPIRSKIPAGTPNGRSPGQFLNKIKKEMIIIILQS